MADTILTRALARRLIPLFIQNEILPFAALRRIDPSREFLKAPEFFQDYNTIKRHFSFTKKIARLPLDKLIPDTLIVPALTKGPKGFVVRLRLEIVDEETGEGHDEFISLFSARRPSRARINQLATDFLLAAGSQKVVSIVEAGKIQNFEIDRIIKYK